MITKSEFINSVDKKFWTYIQKKTLIPISVRKSKTQFLGELYDALILKSYFPSVPRDYLLSPKWKGVTRLIPVFTIRDSCIYYICVKLFEVYIAWNRIEGTYGGFSMWWEIRKAEEEEFQTLMEMIPSSPTSPYNEKAWIHAWRDFQKKAHIYSQTWTYNTFVKLDIANFYDCINLSILEQKLRLLIDKKYFDEIELMMFFLKNWNRKIEWYSEKSVWLPQDEIGDSSRVLANFYLQDYDEFISKLSIKLNCIYLRYSDDQIFMCPSQEIAETMIFESSKALSKIWLNINPAKVDFFSEIEFREYWAFDIFDYLFDPKNIHDVETGVKLYLKWKSLGKNFRYDSVLSRFLSCDISWINASLKIKLLADLLDEEYLLRGNSRIYLRIYSLLDTKNRVSYIKILNHLALKTNFNSIIYSIKYSWIKWVDKKKINVFLKKTKL